MEGIGWLLAIILGAIAGWIAEKIMKSNMGLLMNIVVGIIGALGGNFIFDRILGSSAEGSVLGQLVVAVIGACILIALGRMIRRNT